jgi:hypothetical protein
MILRIAIDAEVENVPYFDEQQMKEANKVMANAWKAVGLPFLGIHSEEDGVVVSIHHHESTEMSNCSDCIQLAQDERN